MPSRSPRLLLVAASAETAKPLAESLADSWEVQAARPHELRDPSRWLDCSAAVAVLDGADGPEGLEALAPLRDLPTAGCLVLVAEATSDELLESALSFLRPGHVVTAPPPGPLLRWAVRSTLPLEPVGEGARVGQRRAAVLLGVSAAIREVLEQVRRVAASTTPVLILGETGTGKELVARSLHEHSPRRDAPFVAVNCGALPETLLEGELFGFQRGAFTGAQRDKQGLFEQADGGTLFLDEIGDTTPALQVKLLRALESGEVRRLGDTRTRQTSVRVVSATHQDLEEKVEDGSFRQDLFYRLNTVTLKVPPLRRRRVDIPFLAQHFAEELGEAQARRIVLPDEFLDVLSQYSFPGNVRELRNAVERAIALARPGEPVSPENLPDALRSAREAASQLPAHGTLRERVEQLEAQVIQDALRRFQGNLTRVAEDLGLSRPGLRQKMRRMGLDRAARR